MLGVNVWPNGTAGSQAVGVLQRAFVAFGIVAALDPTAAPVSRSTMLVRMTDFGATHTTALFGVARYPLCMTPCRAMEGSLGSLGPP